MSIVTEPKRTGQVAKRPSSQREAARQAPPAKQPLRLRRYAAYRDKLLLGLIVAAGLILVAYAVVTVASGLGQADQPLIYYTVQRGDLPITVTERGNLESQDNIEVLCELDDIRGDNIEGTPILWIIPNGSSVKEGELLVELDSAGHRERLDIQILDTERARADHIQAKAQHDNQIPQNKTSYAEAELQVKLAELELEMFVDPQNGTHKLEVEDINRSIDDVNNEILEAQANLELKRNEKLGIESLFKLGYAGKSELDRSRLDFLQAESQFAAKTNRQKTQLSILAKKETYERDMQLLQLEGNVATAKRNVDQAQLNNAALMEQAKAAMVAADRSLKKELERLARYEEQLTKCKIYAPQDGMVAFASSGRYQRAPIAEGTAVRLRQKILTLPNLTHMQVKTAIHESVLDQIKPGLPVTVRVDSFPNRRFIGSVASVAVLPDQSGWMSSDTKVYETIVTINEEVEQLKPGMTAVVEIHVDRLEDVLVVPVQAIVQIQNDNWCYVDIDGQVEKRVLTLGRTNDKFVVLREGIDEGDRVVLNPSAIVEQLEEGESSRSSQEETEETLPDDPPESSPS